MSRELFERCTEIGFVPAHVVEVGVFTPDCSCALPFVEQGARAELFEPNPDVYPQLKEHYGPYPKARVYPYAIAESNGPVSFYRKGASSFLAGLPSTPATVIDHFLPEPADAVEVAGRTFDGFDDGTIDLLAVDTEGAEWFVVQHLKSRPAVLSLEMRWNEYENPFRAEIEAWLGENNYLVWYEAGADVVYRRAEGKAVDR